MSNVKMTAFTEQKDFELNNSSFCYYGKTVSMQQFKFLWRNDHQFGYSNSNFVVRIVIVRLFKYIFVIVTAIYCLTYAVKSAANIVN